MSTKEKKCFSEKKYYNKLIDLTYLEKYNLEIHSEIGRGGFGVVYKCKSHNNNKKYALKILFSTAFPEMISSELAFLKILKDKDLMPKLVQAFSYDFKVHILMEYNKNDRFITFFDSMTFLEIKNYIYCLLQSLNILHNHGIIHRDIKAGNFLYSRKLKTGTLIDFGLSEIELNFRKKISLFQKNELNPQDISYEIIKKYIKYYEIILENEKLIGKNKIGTEPFSSLEVLLRQENQSFEVDIWSVGVMLFQILTRKYSLFNTLIFAKRISYKQNKYNHIISFILELSLIFGTEKLTEILNKFEYEVKFPDEFPKNKTNLKVFIKRTDINDQVLDLVERLLEIDPEKRITVVEALNHPCFTTTKK